MQDLREIPNVDTENKMYDKFFAVYTIFSFVSS